MFLHNWCKLEDVLTDFAIFEKDVEGCEILLASYGYGDYSGDAFVLFRKNTTLYEVNGSHCSCRGLEGQWEPEKTTKEALLYRLDKGELGTSTWHDNEFASELRAVLVSLN